MLSVTPSRHHCPRPGCDKSYLKPYQLQAHLDGHDGIKRYQCTHCSETFTWRSDLATHMRAVRGEDSVTCAGCGKTYASRRSWTRHVRLTGNSRCQAREIRARAGPSTNMATQSLTLQAASAQPRPGILCVVDHAVVRDLQSHESPRISQYLDHTATVDIHHILWKVLLIAEVLYCPSSTTHPDWQHHLNFYGQLLGIFLRFVSSGQRDYRYFNTAYCGARLLAIKAQDLGDIQGALCHNHFLGQVAALACTSTQDDTERQPDDDDENDHDGYAREGSAPKALCAASTRYQVRATDHLPVTCLASKVTMEAAGHVYRTYPNEAGIIVAKCSATL